MKEYRVIWKREGMFKKQKRYAKKESAERFILLMTSPEPWKAYGYDPDEFLCCSGNAGYGGDDCGCGGQTYRESFQKGREGLPKLLSYKIQEREVEAWSDVWSKAELIQ